MMKFELELLQVFCSKSIKSVKRMKQVCKGVFRYYDINYTKLYRKEDKDYQIRCYGK